MSTFLYIAGYTAYMIIGVTWAIYVHHLLEDNPYYQDHHKLGISVIVNFFLWPTCVAAYAYAKILLNRDTLVHHKRNEDRDKKQ